MSYKIAIASGKGGTGKTTVAINLFHFFRKHAYKNICLVDCDIEEPNDVIFFPDAVKRKEVEIFQLVPEINKSKCSFCRECVSYCEFNALVIIPPVQFAEVNKSLCHSCGACKYLCPEDAIVERPYSIGAITFYEVQEGRTLIEGMLKIGSVRQTMLIRELKKYVPDDNDIIIYDAPPGTGCPVVETIGNADYVLLVTEPTLFGFYDLKIMVKLLTDLKIPYGAVINKAGLGNNLVHEYLDKQRIEILGEIPFDQHYAVSYAKGQLFNEILQGISDAYLRIIEKLEERILVHERDNCIKW